MVRSAMRNNPSASEGPARTAAPGASESQGVPSNFSAGQNFTNNPLSALNRADYAGPHMASLLNDAGGMFGNFGGMNPRDPNVMLGMMQNPEFLRHMRDMLGRPEVVDQIIASNPQMQAMGPHVREMLRSEQFRDMITNPEAIQRMAQLSQVLGGGAGGLGGAGLGGAGAAPQWPPPGAFGRGPQDQQQQQQQQGADAGAGAGANPLGGLGGLGGGPSLAQLLGLGNGGEQQPGRGDPYAALAALGGLGGGGLGGLGGGAPPVDTRPPEERYATQLEQLNGMGFYDVQANIRALRLSGGSVEGAVGILLD